MKHESQHRIQKQECERLVNKVTALQSWSKGEAA